MLARTLLLLCWGTCLGVRFTKLGVPGSISKGDSVLLECGYDLEGDELYSVKWYKDNVEFYRFMPSYKPSAQMYSLSGVFLDLENSNATHALLYTSNLETEGTYGCEVSTDVLSSIRTIKAGKELRIHVIPDESPHIYGVQSNYRMGDFVNMSCLFGPSKPSARITWYINEEEAVDSYTISQMERGESVMISESFLQFALEPALLRQGALFVRCQAILKLVHDFRSLELIVGEGTSGAQFQRILHVSPGQEGPSITGVMPKYFVGDVVEVNCSSPRSQKLPELQWQLNNESVRPEFVTTYPVLHYPDGLLSSKKGLRFRVQPDQLRGDEMKLKCTATFYDTVLRTSAETSLFTNNYRTSSFHTSLSDRSGADIPPSSMQWLVLVLVLCSLARR
ncbi:hypothetical protein JTE90_026455 [Oedothorax gibbosus]|uniref:Ig-like domain-containing protein n=1 Tax=Oedothorax gibbosus TaxID=931172 RepID=A0AAV6VPJ0_9ARAC|nr:hypothetical protein JTE90_026455 [Oedothorax gibbosus]